jgi:hypothetical protein
MKKDLKKSELGNRRRRRKKRERDKEIDNSIAFLPSPPSFK